MKSCWRAAVLLQRGLTPAAAGGGGGNGSAAGLRSPLHTSAASAAPAAAATGSSGARYNALPQLRPGSGAGWVCDPPGGSDRSARPCTLILMLALPLPCIGSSPALLGAVFPNRKLLLKKLRRTVAVHQQQQGPQPQQSPQQCQGQLQAGRDQQAGSGGAAARLEVNGGGVGRG